MRRVVRRAGIGVLAALIGLTATIDVLALTTPRPRPAPGWSRLADMPVARGEVAATVGERSSFCRDPRGCKQLFVIGGLTDLGRTVSDVSLYDPLGDRWSAGPSIPEPRHHAAAAALGPTVFVGGGSRTATSWTPERDVWALPADASRWQPVAPMPEGRMGHQLVALAGRLYVVGGRGRTGRVLIFDPRKGWRAGAPMPAARDHLVAVAVGSTIWAIGGRDDAVRPRVDIYDPARDRWLAGPPLPRPMSAMAGGVLGDRRVHVVGGEDPGTFGGGVIDVHLSAPAGASAASGAPAASAVWRVEPLPVLAVHGAAFGVINETLLVAGGARRQGSLSVLGWTTVAQSFRAGARVFPSGSRR